MGRCRSRRRRTRNIVSGESRFKTLTGIFGYQGAKKIPENWVIKWRTQRQGVIMEGDFLTPCDVSPYTEPTKCQTTMYVDLSKRGLDAVILLVCSVKRSAKWTEKVQSVATEAKKLYGDKKRRGSHKHDRRSFMAELGTQTRTTGRPLLLKPKADAGEDAVKDLYRKFDVLGAEAEETWVPLLKAIGAHTKLGSNYHGSRKPSMGHTRAPNGMVTINYHVPMHHDERDGLGVTCCENSKGSSKAYFVVPNYGLKIPLMKGHYKWCFFGAKVLHGSVFDFGSSDKVGVERSSDKVGDCDQITWGSWEHVKKSWKTKKSD